jgi:Leucine-rich repeat (LRR) protein
MRTRFYNIVVIILIVATGGFFCPRTRAQAQTQTQKTGSTQANPGSSKTKSQQTKGTKSGVNTIHKGQTATAKPQQGKTGGKPSGKTVDKNAPKPGALPAGQDSALRSQATGLVKFFESTLNFLADKKNTVQDKQVIINDSYKKFFWDSEVQVEDDLDTHIVPMYKDVQSYLADIDFFFRQAAFTYNLQDISVMTNELGNTFFKVTCNRNITGINLNGDNINTNQVRYIEINYDENKQQLKIVSVYTTKLNEKDDMRHWWNGLSQGWQQKLGKDIQVGGGVALGSVASYNDTVAMIAGQKTPIDSDAYYKGLTQIMGMKKIDLSGDVVISDLSPLSKMSALEEVSLKGTPVSDLMPLRNLNNLQVLDLSNTPVSSLEPLHYCTHIRKLFIKGTGITDLGLLVNFPALEDLDFSNTKISSLAPISALDSIDDLRMAYTPVSDLTPIAGLTNIELLNISSTKVTSLDPLKNMAKLRILQADSTGISSLKALENLPSLQKIYCDYTRLPKPEAINFMLKHPNAFLVFESAELAKWWSGMNTDWQNLLNHFTELSNPPTKEQLHKLILVDSLNIVGRMNIKSLEPAAMLSLLRVLYASSTGVSDIAPLKNLINLQTLYLNNTSVTSLQPLSTLANLKVISIENTQVADLTPLYGMSNLIYVYADNSQVVLKEANNFLDKDPGCLLIFQTFENNNWWKGLSKSWQDVFIAALKLKGSPDKMQLQQIANLETLSFSENFSISDIAPVQKLSRLKNLTFTGTTVNSLASLQNMTTLETLHCGKNPITDLTPISSLSKLKDLDFSNSQVEELMPIQNMTWLENLKFSGTPVKKLKYIINLTGLKTLELYNTKVSSLDEIENMHNLASLKIFNTKISAKRVEKFKQTHPKCEVVYY